MPKRKGRDWTEWKKEITGMHRLDSEWKNHRKVRCYQDQTTTSLTLHRGLGKTDSQDKKEVLKWFLIFLALLVARKIYFEMTKDEKIRNNPTSQSRVR